MRKKHVHEMDESRISFVEGKGYVGVCKICGIKLLSQRRGDVQPRKTEHMSKKYRLKARRFNDEKKI